MANSGMAKIAVIGSGISGAVCASILASKGISVTIFESGRGPGGRMSSRRERMEDGTELCFDHGVPYFTTSHDEVVKIVRSWESRDIVAEWDARFGVFDKRTNKLVDDEKVDKTTKYVGVPAMNSICKALCQEDGVEAKFGVTVGKMNWIQDRSSWSLIGLDGKELGHFDGVVASDKNLVSPRFSEVHGVPPPLDVSPYRGFSVLSQGIPVRPCFALMLAFSEPLSLVQGKVISFQNSDILSYAFWDSSKPSRAHVPPNGQSWVLHSTSEYATSVIEKSSLKKLSNEVLLKIADELFQEFKATGLNIPKPLFMKAHRWGSAFPALAVSPEEKCLWDNDTKLAICGDFCVSPNVDGAILSGIGAASKFLTSLKISCGL
ncbi:NAD(P)-binding Rossmann-like domain-containing protein [Carex littledalei]|uniref:NAD(P)-binding Rossmann-like domain-containing protein n=1 Tax=Carex littledalei TaxID=544730 RepID=A0A833QHY1_9POAL|nr:NAD(P)-binding Rossmann-like domain-containing protein [Carex littledalei]